MEARLQTWTSMIALATLAACDPGGKGGGDATGGFDCEAIAIRDADDNPDPCDLEACTACVDECGVDCVVLESFPPQYACPDESWTVYDFCPTWGSSAATN